MTVGTEVSFLTVDEVATRLGMSKWFVHSHGDELGLVKFGGANRYRADRVGAYLAERLRRLDAEAPSAPPPELAPVRRKPEIRRGRKRRVPLLETDGPQGERRLMVRRNGAA